MRWLNKRPCGLTSASVAFAIINIIIDQRMLCSLPPKCLAFETNWWRGTPRNSFRVIGKDPDSRNIWCSCAGDSSHWIPSKLYCCPSFFKLRLRKYFDWRSFLRVRKWNRSEAHIDTCAAFDRSLISSTIDLRIIHSWWFVFPLQGKNDLLTSSSSRPSRV